MIISQHFVEEKGLEVKDLAKNLQCGLKLCY